ncbi:MAG: hypothetical protein AAF721_04340 [Myxococcota bacterium]
MPDPSVQLVPRAHVVFVRDESHAVALLRQHGDRAAGPATARERETARALARGEMLLIRRPRPARLDAPNPSAVTLLSDLIPGSGT